MSTGCYSLHAGRQRRVLCFPNHRGDWCRSNASGDTDLCDLPPLGLPVSLHTRDQNRGWREVQAQQCLEYVRCLPGCDRGSRERLPVRTSLSSQTETLGARIQRATPSSRAQRENTRRASSRTRSAISDEMYWHGTERGQWKKYPIDRASA